MKKKLKFLAVEGDGGNQIKIPKQNHCLAETGGRGTLVSTLFNQSFICGGIINCISYTVMCPPCFDWSTPKVFVNFFY